jgi:hypothetical protein
MAVFHGVNAKVDLSGALAFATGWSMTLNADVAESSCMSSSWKTYEFGQEDGDATVNGQAATERGTIAQLGVSAALKLYVDDTHCFSLTSICTGITETTTKDDVGKISYTFARNQATDIAYT